jgi:signal transduction histidine kinase
MDVMPRLKNVTAQRPGGWLGVAHAVTMVALLAALVTCVVSLLDAVSFIGKAFPGFGHTSTLLVNPVLFMPDTPEPPDIKLWDRVTTVDGVPVSDAGALAEAFAARAPGTVITLGLVEASGEAKTVRVPMQRFTTYDFFSWHTNQTLLGLIIVLVGGLVLLLRSGPRALTFSLCCLATGLMLDSGVDGTLFRRFPHLFHLSAPMVPAAGMAFALTLSPRLARHPRAYLFWLVPLLLGVLLAVASMAFHGGPVPVFAALGIATYAFLLAGAAGFFFIMLEAWRRPEGPVDRARAGIILWTWPLALGIPAVNLLMGLTLRTWPTTAIPNAAILGLPLGVGYAILRQDLFEADLSLRRIFSDLALTGLATVAYALTLTGAYSLVNDAASSRAVAVALAAGLLVIVIPIRDRFKRRLDAVLEGRRYDADEALAALSDVLSSENSLDRALYKVGRILAVTVRPRALSCTLVAPPDVDGQRVHVVRGEPLEPPPASLWKGAVLVMGGEPGRQGGVYDDNEQREAGIVVGRLPPGVEVVVTLRAAGREVGALLLGPREDGGRYAPADFTFLRALAGQTAPTLAHARAFAEVEDLNRTLEQRVAARTSELTAVNEELRALDRRKDELISTVSHDFRSPLSVIRSHVQTLLADADMDGETRTSFLGVIDRQARRLTAMVENLLDLGRIRTRGVVTRPVPVLELLRGAADAVRPRAEGAGVLLRLDAPPLLVVMADAEMLHRVLQNLLDNATKFTPRGGEVRLWARGEPGHVVMGVSDTGVGIPAADHARVCEPFYQVKRAGPEREGSGLGLAIVKEIVERHGSGLVLTSREGQGTTWEFALPAVEAGAAAPS